MKLRTDLLVLVFLMLSISFFGCDKNSRENFSFERQDYFGDKINLAGYYYREFEENRYAFKFLYNNGVILSVSLSDNIGSENELNDELKSYDFSQFSELPYYWGIFKIEENAIVMEQWIIGDGGPYPILKSEGEILNDSTFLIKWKRIHRIIKKVKLKKPISIMNFYLNQIVQIYL